MILGTIRFLLALAVVFAHAGQPPLNFGVNSLIAVQSFYVISGFLIARIWDIKYAEQPKGIRLFYFNRAARIYLMYWAVLLFALLFALVFFALRGYWPGYLTVDTSLPWLIIVYEIVSNISLAGSSVALFLGATPDGAFYFTGDFAKSPVLLWNLMAIPPAWTLELELWFYLMAPFILRFRLPWIVALCAASFALRFIWYYMGHDADPWAYRFFPFEIGVFLIGVIAYRIAPRISSQRSTPVLAYVIMVGALGIYFPAFLVNHRFLFLVIFAALLPTIFELTKDWRADRFLADTSYPLYLCHWPIVIVAWRWPHAWPGMPATIMAIIYACGLVIFIERPIDRWRHARKFGSDVVVMR